jgi:glycosyltransferase involved in cell wall biosynthesis
VLSIGRLEWQKGHEGALRIVAQLHGATKLCVLAPASTRHHQQLRQLAAHEKASDRLLFRFGLTAEQRRQELQQALCLLSWSETEYQSLAMLEALACGCPVVVRCQGCWWCRAAEKRPG